MSGADGSNECPAGYVRIVAEAACRTAVAAAGKTPASNLTFVQTDPDYPRGCYTTVVTGWFNSHAVGAGKAGFKPLCAAATTGAPSTPLRARASIGRV